ncbi:MAG: DNA gyrase C-terminal beta-propeller domain-containing protein, partial [Rhodospirillales bacterium]|nr:DNA gyrase C-terminal beta-propeller domain-containing protein [Rhodospirillales bacterium]
HDQLLAARLEEPIFAELVEREEFIVTVAADGLGKRTSAYEYRISGRGGKGVTAMDLQRGQERTTVVNVFPVRDSDQLVLVAEGGQIIRVPVNGISVVGRASRGVNVFNVGEGDRVVSVTRLRDEGAGIEDDETSPAEDDENIAGAETESGKTGDEPEETPQP